MLGAATGRPYWYLLIHQLPPRPLYLRAKVRRRLDKVGAMAIKNSVYVLPGRDECLEDFQWIAQEAAAGGGDACVCRAEFVDGLSAGELTERFSAAVAARYEPLKAALDRALRRLRQDRGRDGRHGASPLARLRKRAQEIDRSDFFGSKAGREVSAIMTAIERARSGSGGRKTAGRRQPRHELVGRTWVTRTDPHVDRLATAWLVRRFLDPTARFRFVDAIGGAIGPDEVSFDMTGATFTHDGDRCTFETMVARLELDDRALRPIAEIVHDIDLKDGKFGRPDAHGVHQLLQGLVGAHPDSAARIAAALPVFDALYASFGGRADAPPATRRPAAGRTRSRARSRKP
jgi:hypothetical protein